MRSIGSADVGFAVAMDLEMCALRGMSYVYIRKVVRIELLQSSQVLWIGDVLGLAWHSFEARAGNSFTLDSTDPIRELKAYPSDSP